MKEIIVKSIEIIFGQQEQNNKIYVACNLRSYYLDIY